MQHQFGGHAYTIGIEEELMILDADSLELVNAIEALIEPAPAGEIKPELMESVLEISTEPCANIAQAGEQLRALRRQVAAAAAALRFVARQELIFGMHVHVGLDDPDKAIHVSNGMRVHIPVLLSLSANSPFWRADATGLASTRTPIFRAFPRVGIPPTYKDWQDYERRIEFMVAAKVIEDYTYLWHDVRPHPEFGTVEVRVMDSQTRVEHSLGLAALVQALIRELADHFDSGKRLARYPFEMLDENKWLAARHGLAGELVDLPHSTRVPTRELARRLIERMADHCRDLGSVAELEAVEDLLERGNGAARQVVVYEANHDLREVVAEIVAATSV